MATEQEKHILEWRIQSVDRFNSKRAQSDQIIRDWSAQQTAKIPQDVSAERYINAAIEIGEETQKRRERLQNAASILDGQKTEWLKQIGIMPQISETPINRTLTISMFGEDEITVKNTKGMRVLHTIAEYTRNGMPRSVEELEKLTGLSKGSIGGHISILNTTILPKYSFEGYDYQIKPIIKKRETTRYELARIKKEPVKQVIERVQEGEYWRYRVTPKIEYTSQPATPVRDHPLYMDLSGMETVLFEASQPEKIDEETDEDANILFSRQEALVLANMIAKRNGDTLQLPNGKRTQLLFAEEEPEYLESVLDEQYTGFLEDPDLRTKLGYFTVRQMGLKKIQNALATNTLNKALELISSEEIVNALQLSLTSIASQRGKLNEIIAGLLGEDEDVVFKKEKSAKKTKKSLTQQSKQQPEELKNQKFDITNPIQLKDKITRTLTQFEEHDIYDETQMTTVMGIFNRLRNMYIFDHAEYDKIISPIGRARSRHTRKYSRLDYMRLICTHDAGNKFRMLSSAGREEVLAQINEIYDEVVQQFSQQKDQPQEKDVPRTKKVHELIPHVQDAINNMPDRNAQKLIREYLESEQGKQISETLSINDNSDSIVDMLSRGIGYTWLSKELEHGRLLSPDQTGMVFQLLYPERDIKDDKNIDIPAGLIIDEHDDKISISGIVNYGKGEKNPQPRVKKQTEIRLAIHKDAVTEYLQGVIGLSNGKPISFEPRVQLIQVLPKESGNLTTDATVKTMPVTLGQLKELQSLLTDAIAA